MLYRIGNQKLNIPESVVSHRSRTPRQIVPWRDVAETCRTLDALCQYIPKSEKRIRVLDAIARSGFWGAIFRNCWPNCQLHLNESDASCNDVLHSNFPDAQVTNENIRQWVPPPSDVVLLDFDKFTLRILDQWIEVLQRFASRCKELIIADGACFGFKFGNLRHYGITKEDDYYYKLDESLFPLLQKHVVAVSKFRNAAVVLLENRQVDHIEFLPPTDLFLSRGNQIYKPKRTERTGFEL